MQVGEARVLGALGLSREPLRGCQAVVDIGHASVLTRLDRYGHLVPGSEGEAAELLDTYLAAAR